MTYLTPARPPAVRRHDARPTPLRDSPFAFTRPAPRRGLIDRWFARPRPDLASQALQHLLTRRDPTTISQTEISDLLIAYGLAGAAARRVLTAMWRRVLEIFLADDALSNREIAYLEALRNTLALSDAETSEAERLVIHPRYEMAVRDALADESISVEERESLARLAKQLRLPPEVEREIYHRSARRTLHDRFRASVEDRRLSPDELEQLRTVARHLGVDRPFDQSTEALLDRYAFFWRVENGDLPKVDTSLPLPAGESCHFECTSALYEPRDGSNAAAEREGIVSVRIARGVYYRAGSVSTDMLRLDHLSRAGNGRFCLTDQHVHFMGEQHTLSLPLKKLTAFQVYVNGLVLEKRGTPVASFALDGDTETAAVILGAAMARA